MAPQDSLTVDRGPTEALQFHEDGNVSGAEQAVTKQVHQL